MFPVYCLKYTQLKILVYISYVNVTLLTNIYNFFQYCKVVPAIKISEHVTKMDNTLKAYQLSAV